MQDTAKYLIHAKITANGVVERSDVVGAIFGQTEGLLGDDLDLRDLQQSSKVGRIDVEITSEGGQSFGDVTIASGMDKVETAILGAALETIERVGPCRANVEVDRLEDVRAAKRREVVERAKELLSSFEGDVLTSQELVDEVRRAVRVDDITEYEGFPAGPRVAASDAIIVVEGRADVLQLLQYGIKNAVAVEGTDVPSAVATLTQDRTVTAFLDGDRGGDLILKELEQVASVDYVAFPPAGKSVEELSRDEVMTALREKVPVDVVSDASSPHETVAATDGSSRPAPPGTADDGAESAASAETPTEPDAGQPQPSVPDTSERRTTDEEGGTQSADPTTEVEAPGPDAVESDAATPGEAPRASAAPSRSEESDGTRERDVDDPEHEEPPEQAVEDPAEPPATLGDYVTRIIGDRTGEAVLLDDEFEAVERVSVEDAFGAIAQHDPVPATVVLDGEVSQRLLDVAAQRGVDQLVGRETGEFVKQPVAVRVRTADEFQ